MDENPKDVDLSRREYRADGIKGEPLFGPGWPFGVAALITIAVGVLFEGSTPVMHVIGGITGTLLVTVFYSLL